MYWEKKNWFFPPDSLTSIVLQSVFGRSVCVAGRVLKGKRSEAESH